MKSMHTLACVQLVNSHLRPVGINAVLTVTHRMDAIKTHDWQASGAMFEPNVVLCMINLSCA